MFTPIHLSVLMTGGDDDDDVQTTLQHAMCYCYNIFIVCLLLNCLISQFIYHKNWYKMHIWYDISALKVVCVL